MDFKRDSHGIEAILKSPAMRSVVRERAESIAAVVRGTTGKDVVVDSYTTDRAAASVTIRDRLGRLYEVRDGVLSRGAFNAGLEFRRR